ncbi:MAG: hypothetical protein WDW36_006136 [Sanguina aurantia]
MQSSSKLVVVERRAVDVVVLGNGSLAASAAYSLARRGKRVVLIPNLGFPKTATSASTVLRPLHIPHPKPELAHLAAESAAYWRGLQTQCPSNKMMWPCSSLDVGLNASGSTTQEAMSRIQDACKAASVKCASLSAQEIEAVAPLTRVPRGFAGLLQVDGAVLDSKQALAGLSFLSERQSVMVKDRLILRGWRDFGDHFTFSASSELLPYSMSHFEAEQVLLAPDSWAPQSLQLFGIAADLQVLEVSHGRFAAAPSSSALPSIRHLGGLQPASDVASNSVCWSFPNVGGGPWAHMGASPSAGVNLCAPGSGPWNWTPKSNRSALEKHSSALHTLVPSLGPLPPSSMGSSTLLASRDGMPAVGFHSGFEQGRFVIALAASCSCDPAFPPPSPPQGSPTTSSTSYPDPSPSISRGQAHSMQNGNASGGSSAGPRDTNPSTTNGADQAGQPGGGSGSSQSGSRSDRGRGASNEGKAARKGVAVIEETPEQKAMLRSLGVDGFQLAPLLGKMAADLLCGGSIAEVEPGLVLLSRPGVGLRVASLGSVDPWDQLDVLQRGDGSKGGEQEQLEQRQRREDDAEEDRRARAA